MYKQVIENLGMKRIVRIGMDIGKRWKLMSKKKNLKTRIKREIKFFLETSLEFGAGFLIVAIAGCILLPLPTVTFGICLIITLLLYETLSLSTTALWLLSMLGMILSFFVFILQLFFIAHWNENRRYL